MNRYSKVLLTVVLLIAASGTALADDVGFTGNYAAGNWTFFNNGVSGGGSISPTTMTITGSNAGCGFFCNPAPGASDTGFLTTAAYAATISFNWSFTTFDSDGTGFDYPFYVTINGTTFWAQSGSTTQSGTISFSVNAGDVFGFGVHSVDQIFGPGVLDITNFKSTSTSQVPEPASLFLMGTGLVAAAGSLRKRFAKA